MPFHPLLVHFPVALWITSLLFDLISLRREDPVYRRAAWWLVGLGLLGAAVSIASGWIDLLAYERGSAPDPGIVQKHRIHSIVAYASTAVYLGNFLWRWRSSNRPSGALTALSVLGAILIAIAGYVGGALRSAM